VPQFRKSYAFARLAIGTDVFNNMKSDILMGEGVIVKYEKASPGRGA
jgi:hypothetical protein